VSFSDSNRTSIRVIEEATWGTTPASGPTREVRLTSSSLTAEKTTVVSSELRSDRMVSAVTEVAAMSAGDINFEVSSGPQDEFLAAFLMSNWSRPMDMDFVKGPLLSITSTTTLVVAGKDVSGLFPAGTRVLLKGWVNAANLGYFSIASATFAAGSTTITFNEATAVVEAGSTTSGIYDANDVIVLNSITVSSTATGFAITSAGFAAPIAANQLVVGQKIYVEGLAGAVGQYTITALTSTNITTSPAPGAIVVAGSKVNIKGAMLRNPNLSANIAQRKFSIETGYTDVGQYLLQTGMVPGKWTLDLSTGAIITGSFSFDGRSTTIGSTSILGSAPYTVLPAQNGEVVNATVSVGSLMKNGAVLTASLQKLSIAGEAGLRFQAAIGSKFPKGVGAGRFGLTGSISAYFEDAVLFNHFLNSDTVALGFTTTDLNGFKYAYTLPAVKFVEDKVLPGGIDQDVVNAINYTAFRDSVTECMIQIDRFSPTLV
jgi:hypothetical protein